MGLYITPSSGLVKSPCVHVQVLTLIAIFIGTVYQYYIRIHYNTSIMYQYWLCNTTILLFVLAVGVLPCL